jgi:hypothetical protein
MHPEKADLDSRAQLTAKGLDPAAQTRGSPDQASTEYVVYLTDETAKRGRKQSHWVEACAAGRRRLIRRLASPRRRQRSGERDFARAGREEEDSGGGCRQAARVFYSLTSLRH